MADAVSLVVQFYHEDDIRGLPSGTRLFEVGTIGWKWVKIRTPYEPQWHRIKRKTWNKISKQKDYKVIQSH